MYAGTALMILVHSVKRMGEDNVEIMSALFTNYPIEAFITLLKMCTHCPKYVRENCTNCYKDPCTDGVHS
jgi:hypothetical protein